MKVCKNLILLLNISFISFSCTIFFDRCCDALDHRFARSGFQHDFSWQSMFQSYMLRRTVCWRVWVWQLQGFILNVHISYGSIRRSLLKLAHTCTWIVVFSVYLGMWHIPWNPVYSTCHKMWHLEWSTFPANVAYFLECGTFITISQQARDAETMLY